MNKVTKSQLLDYVDLISSLDDSKSEFQNNSVDCLEQIFELMNTDYNDFVSMTNDQRSEFVRELKLNKILE